MKSDNAAYYQPHRIYVHKSLLYTCKFVGIQRKKPTYEIVSTNDTLGFKVGDQFTPNEPDKWFHISNVPA